MFSTTDIGESVILVGFDGLPNKALCDLGFWAVAIETIAADHPGVGMTTVLVESIESMILKASELLIAVKKVLQRPAVVESVAVLAAGAVIRQLFKGGSVAPLSALIASNSNMRCCSILYQRQSGFNITTGH